MNKRKNKFPWQLLLQGVQAFSAIGILGLAIYGAFFSEFSKLIETELRDDLINAKKEVSMLEEKQTSLSNKIAKKEEQLSALEQNLEVLKLNLESIQAEKQFYLNTIKKNIFSEYKRKMERDIRLIDAHITFGENFDKLNDYIEALKRGERRSFLELDPALRTGEVLSLSTNLIFAEFGWVVEDLSEKEIAKRRVSFIEKYQTNLAKPLTNISIETTNTKNSFLGRDLISEIRESAYFGNFTNDDWEVFFQIVDSFVNKHEAILSKPLIIVVSKDHVEEEEILLKAKTARENFEEFKTVFNNFLIVMQNYEF